MDELTQMNADPETRAAYYARVREMNHLYVNQKVKYDAELEEGEKIGVEKGRAEE